MFLNPLQIRLPVTASVSFGHRVSGVLLAVAMPFLVWALALSLRDQESYGRLLAVFGQPLAAPALVVLAWCLAHHVAAGVRHLLFDAGIGTALTTARKTAWVVHGFALGAAVLAAGAVLA